MYSMPVINLNLNDINPIQYGWQDCPPDHSYGPAYRDFYLIHYILSGEGIFRRGSETYALKAGSMFLIRPGELTFYKADTKNPWRYSWIGFNGSRCEKFLDSTAFSGGRCWAEVPYLEGSFKNLKSTESDELRLVAVLYEIFSLLQKHNSETRTVDYVNATVDYMKANYALPIKIEEIADTIGIDRRYLCRMFSAELGVSPKEYLTALRMERAKSLLLFGGISVMEVARSVGYEDAFNFSRMFKNRYGVSPAHFAGNRKNT